MLGHLKLGSGGHEGRMNRLDGHNRTTHLLFYWLSSWNQLLSSLWQNIGRLSLHVVCIYLNSLWTTPIHNVWGWGVVRVPVNPDGSSSS